nr:TonB family protein [uncultured Desulfuromonas sp.]
MTSSSTRYNTLLIGLIISLLIHATLLLLKVQWPEEKQPVKKPILVEVQPTQPVQETAIPSKNEPPKQAERTGAVDHQVIKEQAPPGQDLEDSSPKEAQPAPTKPKTVPPPKPEKKEKPVPVVKVAPQQPETSPQVAKEQPLPSLDQLLQTANNAAANITQQAQTKARPDVEPGDDLLLNMREDKLFSFFSRFKKQIYGVWNYPEEAMKNRQQGVALLKIVINRDGSVEDVDLVSASGFERLDREAIAAIFKAQPYGSLPESYPEDQLTIMAYFEYILGQPLPNIYRR